MPSLDTLLEPIRKSPFLVDAAKQLVEDVKEEAKRRQLFYEEMTDEMKVEFIGGEVILHSPARRHHLIATELLLRLLGTYVDSHGIGEVQSEKCLCVFPRNDYEPDIVFFGNEKAAKLESETMKFPVPDFVVEVLSKSTAKRNRGVKFEDYASHGIAEYWIIDPGKESVEQYLVNNNGEFELALKSSSGEIKSEVIDGFEIPVRSIFDKEENLRALRGIIAGA